jgi:hypothetical protein
MMRAGWFWLCCGRKGRLARRHGIVTESAPRMATHDSAKAEPRATQRAVRFDGLEKIMRACGLITTPGVGPENHLERRADQTLVKTDQAADEKGDHLGNHAS